MVKPDHTLVRYEIDITRLIDRRLKLGMANGKVFADDVLIYSATDLKVGLFHE